MLRTGKRRSLYTIAHIIEISFCIGFKFSSLLNILWFIKSGLENHPKICFTTKRNSLSGVWGDLSLGILQSAGGRLEHSADRIVSDLQLPGKPSRTRARLQQSWWTTFFLVLARARKIHRCMDPSGSGSTGQTARQPRTVKSLYCIPENWHNTIC